MRNNNGTLAMKVHYILIMCCNYYCRAARVNTGSQLHESADAVRLALRILLDMERYRKGLEMKTGWKIMLARTPAESTAQIAPDELPATALEFRTGIGGSATTTGIYEVYTTGRDEVFVRLADSDENTNPLTAETVTVSLGQHMTLLVAISASLVRSPLKDCTFEYH